MSDVCVRKIKASYAKWPSARASQAVAKCRKARGIVRKGAEGKSLRRWGREKWKDTISGKACGAGEKAQYCRPTKKVSKQTPVMRPTNLKRLQNLKRRGVRANR